MSVPTSVSSSKYLPRRFTLRIRWPGNSFLIDTGTGQRRRTSRITMALIVCPLMWGMIPRRVVSTSGSSGIVCDDSRQRVSVTDYRMRIPACESGTAKLSRTVGRRDAAVERTGMYLQRVLESLAAPDDLHTLGITTQFFSGVELETGAGCCSVETSILLGSLNNSLALSRAISYFKPRSGRAR